MATHCKSFSWIYELMMYTWRLHFPWKAGSCTSLPLLTFHSKPVAVWVAEDFVRNRCTYPTRRYPTALSDVHTLKRQKKYSHLGFRLLHKNSQTLGSSPVCSWQWRQAFIRRHSLPLVLKTHLVSRQKYYPPHLAFPHSSVVSLCIFYNYILTFNNCKSGLAVKSQQEAKLQGERIQLCI